MWPRFWFFDFLVNIESILGRWSLVVSQGPDGLLRSGLAHFLLQSLARIPHTLILVRIRRTQRPHFRRHLAHLLPVDSSKSNLRLLGINGSLDASRQRIFDGMRVAQAEHYRSFALHLGAIANADDFQFARPALGHAFDRIIDQGARQSVQGSLRIVLANGDEVPVFLLHLDA